MSLARIRLLIGVLLVLIVPALVADDTELYRATYETGATGRPKVLVIFDDSGSMDEIVYGSKPAYDPTATYVSSVPADRVYWSEDGSPPEVTGDEADQWFEADKNRCGESEPTLDSFGNYTTLAARWQIADGEWKTRVDEVCTFRIIICLRREERETTYWDGQEAKWLELSADDNDPAHVDCQQDVANENSDNGTGQPGGYPRAADSPDATVEDAYVDSVGSSNVSWGGDAYTFYTSHYMDWYYDTSIVTEDKDYLQIAQEVIGGIVQSNTAIDFGLAVFNNNDQASTSGGRVVQRIIEGMSLEDRNSLVTTLDSVDHAGWTPLCETTYEAFRYMSGDTPEYAYSRADVDTVVADPLAFGDGGNYISPLAACSNTYIILMTDGLPTRDGGANTEVQEVSGENCRTYGTGDDATTSCLAVLTDHMATTDLDNDSSNGFQYVPTATIGFNVPGNATDLLTDAATLVKENGDPAYYYAESADDLTASFQQIILGILSSESTFTSPAVAVDSFSRTQSRDDVFFAMFEPTSDANWSGNIKKLKLAVSNGSARLEDVNGNAAIDGNGLIADSARSYWSSNTDGSSVAAGGVGELLKNRDLSTRSILSNTGVNGALQTLNTTNMVAAAYGFTEDAELFSLWGVEDQGELASTIDWLWGYDADDLNGNDSTTDTRSWIMADILHSKPLVVNYGALGSFTTADPDLRIIAGTNNGLLHMFGNNDGQEDWAFFAKELADVPGRRRNSSSGSDTVYGIDSPAVVYKFDANADGTFNHVDGDKVYLFFGLRRGGALLYALDISNPDSPSFMWSLSPLVSGFDELGQTWSVPVVTSIPGYSDSNGDPKPVLAFGAGYDTAKDDQDSLAGTGTQDAMGRGLFIVDAVSGSLVWSVTPDVDSAKNLQATALTHSVAAPVTAFDSNGDERTDRIYFVDTGGNLWRVDMAGASLPTSAQDTWFIHKVFASNGGTTATDRRFFSAPDVARASVEGRAVDAIMLGTGDRTNPIDRDNPDDNTDVAVDNQFYMILDEQPLPYAAALDNSKCETEPEHDFRCKLPLSPTDLYDITDNDIQDGTAEEIAAASAGLNSANGWRLDLEADGEKSLARSLTIQGKLFFTTFSPVLELSTCGFSAGSARLYILDLLTGAEVQDFNSDNDTERSWIIGGLIADTPSPHFGSDGQIRLLLPPGDGADGQTTGNPLESGASIPGPYGSYWYQEEY
ncbi:MAG: hypothetical protein AAGI11_01685 [Pseudomonadota bacterium]